MGSWIVRIVSEVYLCLDPYHSDDPPVLSARESAAALIYLLPNWGLATNLGGAAPSRLSRSRSSIARYYCRPTTITIAPIAANTLIYTLNSPYDPNLF